MVVDAPPRDDDPAAFVEDDPVEVLIEEARQRARRWRRAYCVAASIVAIAVGAGIVAVNGAGWLPGHGSAGDAEAEAPTGDLGGFEPIRGWIVYSDGAGIYAVDPDNPSSTRTVVEEPYGPSPHVAPLGWSGDGTKLVLYDETNTGLWVMDSTGSLTNFGGPPLCCGFVTNNPMSPDGTTFAPDVDVDIQVRFELPGVEDPDETRIVEGDVESRSAV
jgi:hypothetical protein